MYKLVFKVYFFLLCNKKIFCICIIFCIRIIWRCLVKSFNERNPFEMLVVKNNSLTTLFILPVIYWRKGRITSSRHDPYGLGYTRVTMVITKGSNGANRSESLKITSVRIVLCNSRT